MASKITLDVLGAQPRCPLKAYYLLNGEAGVKSDFEALALERRQEVASKAIAKVQRHYTEDQIESGTRLSAATLRKQIPFILSGNVEDERYAVRIHGLKLAVGASLLGRFHYEPVLFTEARRVSKADRHLLAVCAVLLSRLQGIIPVTGLVCLGPDGVMTSVRFGAQVRAAEDCIHGTERLQRADTPPKLMLNDHCAVCEFRDRCRGQAVSEDNLSLLRGIGEKVISRYRRKGLQTLTQLAHTFRPRRRGKRADRPAKVRDHALHALAIRDKTIYVLGKPELPTAPVRIYVDVEGDPDRDFIYLIGAVVCDGKCCEVHTFWANGKRDEALIFNQFIDMASRYEAPRLYCYGSYEKIVFAQLRRHAKRKKQSDAVLAVSTNVLAVIYPHFYFPVYSNGLKDVGSCLGCRWSEPGASGLQSIVWRTLWERTGDEDWKVKLLQYNVEDCQALRLITEFLADSCGGAPAFQSPTSPRVASVEELDKLSRTVMWPKFVHEDFDFVNKRAWFDYQRTRVFARTTPARKRIQRAAHKRSWKNRHIRATHQLDVTASTCPFCKSREIAIMPRRSKGTQTRRKRSYDIIVTPGAVKRKIIEVRATAYQCARCSRYFIPDSYNRLAKHFHGFMSWSVYHQITHRLGIKSLRTFFHDVFGIYVNPSEFLAFRSLLARYYRKTYKCLLAELLAGPVLHIDETEIKLTTATGTDTGYVWVCANADTAIYFFRPSREGDFLRQMLDGFGGVLVSDFYAAYDGLDHVQQRCLIHLMRDMNRAILDSPFDQELQSITEPFGAILRAIVTTIDEQGLKRRHLERHAKAVNAFFEGLQDRVCETDASKALRDRLLRNRDRLFTFIHRDGVSWNNNLAENAIKRVSDLREDVGRSMKESGLAEQLVLLSLYQTCRVRGVSFLRFLLSRERNMEAFVAGKRPRHRSPRIELYPKRYTPPSLISLRREKIKGSGANR
jgi:predicted RecB family nuclease